MVRIRLARRGRRKLAVYDVVVADARAPRDGRFIEKLGTYNPQTVPAKVDVNADRAFHWLMQGAQPSDTVRTLLSDLGVLLRKHLQIGVIKGAITQEQADAKLAEWLKAKEDKLKAAADKFSQSKAAQAKARREAENKVREARAEAIRKKAEAAASDASAPAEGAGGEATAVSDETPAEEAKAE
jgi:small subunit ribosomal protein S16